MACNLKQGNWERIQRLGLLKKTGKKGKDGEKEDDYLAEEQVQRS